MFKAISLTFIAIVLLSFVLNVLLEKQRGELFVAKHWSQARRDSAKIAPDPLKYKDQAIIQIYVAPTYGWKGLVAVHPWIIYKAAGETHFNRWEVVSWGSNNVVRHNYTQPDGYWFGARPRLLVDYRAADAQTLIPRIQAAINSYPWPHSYRAWPGPNSNTFMAHIGRQVPELGLDLPANAIGKDYRPLSRIIGLSPSGQGVQLSLLGVLGFTAGVREGVEINVLALNVGVDFNPPALRLPFIGRLGFDKQRHTEE